MNYNLRIRPEAERDLSQAYSWYKSKSADLGDDFLHRIENSFLRIKQNPLLYPVIHKQARRMLVRSFPYSIIFVLSDKTITVIAVFHFKRDPKNLASRLSDT